jgi:DNA (cytosine-5)-methyltransferase 1
MRHGSLFSGIGGFDLAAEWMGWENVFHCEWMEFPRKVLDYYFPNADSHIDICKTDFQKYANKIDILTGGFPCQPFSMAGKRKGTDDERYLWGEMLRAVQEIKPKFVIAENVFGITNIDGGMVFEQVCLDLETQGYEVQSFIIPAAAKNAPHRRDRVWFVAFNTNSIRSPRSENLQREGQ